MSRRVKVQLTELENTLLGVVWRRGPCSAYAAQREFAESPSSEWSSSAGSIYPALLRLEIAGLIKGEKQAWGQKGRTVFSLTQRGLAALRNWVSDFDSASGAMPDRVRARVFFLDVYPATSDRLQLIERAISATTDSLAKLCVHIEDLKQKAEHTEWLAELGAVYELEGRLKWLRRVSKDLIAS